ncbi:TPA: RNA-directed DNA polymerase [Legionella pneumophila]|uniref:RNA-directed DNA polymerase n=1 Tax=Legionella pneumophila TaxID=446 RepID=UPI0007771B01|nr:RNA-directed DNA polymerase [Legionella pneumophila]HAT8258362.1 reverse transcriptase [Legionella pneumophila]HAT8261487.1 reverse transcriptase [Legionella pneumophila]HAT8270840.1 reverse transcriptase [Legionella pneumophila]HAT8273966.1 reverse transcriptase [Legionella pneumophila]HAT8639792.1 reverse transcriptase [Legionella pneumophila]
MLREKGNISLLNMSANMARKFFFKEESYCNFDLPSYFKFAPLLKKIHKEICDQQISNLYNGKKPKDYECVNHEILNNKDGKYSWRPFQLIHPALYVALVCRLTEKENWETITNRFKDFSANNSIKCASIPIHSKSKYSDRAAQITTWWNDVEQKSIELALDFQYIIKTDITDCYGSIYSHSISWAIHGKNIAKDNRRNKQKYIGNFIDVALQEMHHGQTNGIPQGSALMDFIAEIVLGYADKKLSEKLIEFHVDQKEYYILRYRDDYRVFVNNPIIGDLIVKCLCEVLASLGLKLNPNKTHSSQEVINLSIKPEKLFWINEKQFHKNLQKHILIIHGFSKKYSNSGSIIVPLQEFYSRLNRIKIQDKDVVPLISIIVDIAYNSPKLYPDCAAILSLLISKLKSKIKKFNIINKISIKFDKIPNTGHLQIWLQRISLSFKKNYQFNELLCKKLVDPKVVLWNSEWLSQPLKDIVDHFPIVDKTVIDTLPEIIEKEEVNLFHVKQGYYN